MSHIYNRLLTTAATLFYRQGIAATGVDSIIKHAGVAKQSLYNHFSSKSELVAAYLQHRHQEWLCLYQQRLKQAHSAKDKVLAVFLAYQDHAESAYSHGFRGCGLLNAAAELPVGDTGRDTVRTHKEEVEWILATHLAEHQQTDMAHVLPLARHLAYLLEGAITRAGLEGNSRCLEEAKQFAEHLLEQA